MPFSAIPNAAATFAPTPAGVKTAVLGTDTVVENPIQLGYKEVNLAALWQAADQQPKHG